VPYTYTHVAEPSASGLAEYNAELAKRRIVLASETDDQNDATSGPDSNEPYPFPRKAGATPTAEDFGLSITNRFRGGDTITGLTGVMQHAFGTWRLRPVSSEDYTFAPSNPLNSPAVPGRLKVSAFNVLNYFATIDTTSSSNNGPCGPAGTADCRGGRQRR
jgi:predicted extracellular nuclease